MYEYNISCNYKQVTYNTHKRKGIIPNVIYSTYLTYIRYHKWGYNFTCLRQPTMAVQVEHFKIHLAFNIKPGKGIFFIFNIFR